LCRRAHEPSRGLWALPAGFVEAKETLEEAVARELREEVGIECAPSDLSLYHITSIPHMSEVYVGFRLQLCAEPALVLGHEVLEALFCSEAGLPLCDLAFEDMLAGVLKEFFNHLRMGHFPVVSAVILPNPSPTIL
jgi:ADP-ribose pyrophosphatase YjhB (NUDIX family)